MTGLASAALASSIALGSGIAAAQGGVLPPGLEGDVAALVFPGSEPPELAEGIAVSGASVERTHVSVDLEGGPTRGTVHLLPRGAVTEGVRVGETASFAVWLIEGGEAPALRAAAEALVERVAARDAGGFFEQHAIAPAAAERGRGPPTARSLGGSPGPLRALVWLALLVGLAVVLWQRRREAGSFAAADRIVAGLLFVGALALRLLLAPWAPLHNNAHGIEEVRGLIGDPAGYEAALYGSAYLDAARVVLAPFGRWPDGPFVFAAVAGASTVVLLFALGRTLIPHRRVGATVAGLALAIHPTHIRLSVSESARPLAGALFLLGCVLAIWAFGERRRSAARAAAWLTASLAWALAAELRVITMLLPWAGLWFVLAARARRRDLPPVGALFAGAVVVIGLSLLHLPILQQAFAAAGQRPLQASLLLQRAVGPQNVLLDPTLTAPLLLPLAAVAGARLWWIGERRLVVAATGAFFVLLAASLLVHASRTDAIRYQSEAHFILMLLFVGLPEWPRGAHRAQDRWWILAPIALSLSAIPGWIDVAQPDVHAQAYAVVRRSRLSSSARVLVAPLEMPLEPRVRTAFPDYLLDPGGQAGTTCRVWVGVSCWSFSAEEVAAGLDEREVAPGTPLRAECAELLGGPERAADVIAELRGLDVPHRGGEFHSIVAPRPRVGFARCPSRR